MPIFLTVEGVDGTVTAGAHSGGVLVGMGDGSVRFLKDTINPTAAGGGLSKGGTGALRSVNGGNTWSFEPTFTGGVSVASADLNAAVRLKGAYVSRISAPDSPFGAVDSRYAGAVSKTRTLFAAQRSRVTSLTVTFSTSGVGVSNAAAGMQHSNNLRQIGIALHRRIPAMSLFVSDAGNSRGVAIKLRDVMISNHSIGAERGFLTDTVTLNFERVPNIADLTITKINEI